MSNTVEFILKLKDHMSSMMSVVSAKSISELNKVDDAVARIPKSFNKINPGISSSGSMLGSVFSGAFLANVATSIGSGILNTLKNVGTKAITGLFDKEKALAGLKTFVSDDIGKALYNNLSNSSASNIFDDTSLINASKGLIGAGENAVKAQSDVLALANAVVGSGGGQAEFDRMASNMQQIKTLGVATAMDIKQFGIANMNVYKMLSDATGKSIAEVKEMNVSYELLSMAIQKSAENGGLYFGAIDNYLRTLPGMWDMTTKAISKAFTSIGEMVKPAIGAVMGEISKLTRNIPALLQQAKPIFDFINNSIIGTIQGINAIVEGTSEWNGYFDVARQYVQTYWGYITKIGASVGALLKGIIDWVKHSQILKDVYSLITQFATGSLQIVTFIADKLYRIWTDVVKPILDGIEQVYRWIRGTPDIKATVAVKSDIPVNKGDSNWMNDNPYLKTGIYKESPSFGSSGINNGGTGMSAKGITSSGPRSIVVNIQKEMIGKLEVNTTHLREGIGQIEEIIKEHFYRLLISLETSN